MSESSKTAQKKEKLNYKLTILTGFGFLATSIAWGIYDPYITKILNKLLSESAVVTAWSDTLVTKMPFLTRLAEAQGEDVALVGGGFTLVPLFIGIIMTFDNIFGVIFQPAFGRLSDNCHSKLGKRRPFIVTCAPISAVLFFLIPIIALKTGSLPATMICIILFVFVMSLWRAPVVALMPDLTPPALRSEGNAVINLMGGLGTAIGFIAGTIAIALCTTFSGVTREQIQANETLYFPYVFGIGAVVMIIGMLVLLFFVKEADTSVKLKGEVNAYADAKARRRAEKEAKAAEKAARKAIRLSRAERKSLLFMLGCLFFLFCGSNAITTFFSLFAQEILHKITSQATILTLIFAVVAAIAALPAGKIGKKFGRKKTIMAGLSIFLAAFILFFGIFIAILAGKHLSVSKYVNVNNTYIAINDQINEYNSMLADAADANDDALVMLSYDGYVDFLRATEAGDPASEESPYVDFDAYLSVYSSRMVETAYNNGAEPGSVTDLYSSVIGVARNALGGSDVTSFTDALADIANTVKDVTRILGILVYPVLILGGAANMFITVNTLPLVLEIGGVEKVGTFTGYYYTATFSAQIASPIVYGFIRMFAGTYMSLFLYCPITFIAALLCILFVKHGEAVPDEVIRQAEEQGD